jgi:hypothetical protein
MLLVSPRPARSRAVRSCPPNWPNPFANQPGQDIVNRLQGRGTVVQGIWLSNGNINSEIRSYSRPAP